MRLLIAAALIFFARGGQAFNWPQWGRCPSLPVEQNFDIDRYMGYWYQQFGHNTVVDKEKGRCSFGVYNTNDGRVVNVFNAEITSQNTTQSVNGTAVLVDPSKNEGHFIITLLVKWYFWWFKVSGPYFILGTDYEIYSVVYSCENFFFFFHYHMDYELSPVNVLNLFSIASSWLLSREQDLDSAGLWPKYKRLVNNTLKKDGMSLDMFNKVDQQNCN